MVTANLHPKDALNDVSDFYTEIVGDRHIADLDAWHITSRLHRRYFKTSAEIFKRYSFRFWRRIGTHALANAMSSKVEHLIFCR